jgi:Arc/MetJ-type ribon-helix-helix transcriptional regulator
MGLREEFIAWLQSKGLNKYYAKGLVSCLDRHVKDKRIKEAMDIVNIFANIESGRHELIPALHALLNFARLKGAERVWIEALKEAIPKREIGVDLKIPSEDDIVRSLQIVERDIKMKTLKISDVSHRKLTATLGTLMAQTGKMQTYQDVIEAMLNQSVKLTPELLTEIENFIEENKQLGYTTREEFIRDAARWRLKFLREESEYLGIPREKHERLEAALKDMSILNYSASDFINKEIKETLKKYDV